MKFHAFKIFLFALVICSVSAKRRWGSSKPASKPAPRPSRPSGTFPSNTGHHPGRQQSSDFLLGESGRPSLPKAPTHTNPPHVQSPHTPYPTGIIHQPSAPPAKPPITQERHQQTHTSVSNTDPYGRQPAQNPHPFDTYKPSGGYHPGGLPVAPQGISVPTSHSQGGSPLYPTNIHNTHSQPGGSAPYPTNIHNTHSQPGGSAPYPTNLPNHPHPGPVSYPTLSHTSSHPVNQPIHPQSYPNNHYGAPPPYSPAGGGYHPGGYQAPPAYQPPTAPFVPGRTVYVVSDSGHKSSSGPGLGTYIGSAVAGGVAAGATNAIVDHAISSIFRPSSNHIHTYPSAPPVGTPTSSVTHTTNNYYYGSPGSTDSGSGNGNANQGSSAPVSQPANSQPAAQPAQTGTAQVDAQPSAGTLANPGVASTAPSGTQGSPSTQTNGVASKAPDGQPEIPPSNFISDEDLMKFTEELFDKADSNLNQHVELNLQKRAANVEPGATVHDDAPEPLFKLKPELDTIPTVTTLRKLYDNYERDGTKKENLTPERRAEETAFLDEIMKTATMTRALNWLGEKKYIETDNYEQKDLLRRMWFNNFDETSSGFERIFLSEKFGDSGIVGMQNWLYFAHLEGQNNVNYLSYVDTISLSGKGSLLKLNYQTEGFTMQNATIFVGTPPELELALYTVCFHARPNNWCPVSLGGAKFFILTHSFRYFGKDLIDLGFPAF